jgi:hypothetical protein
MMMMMMMILTTVTLAISNSALADDGDCTETCWSCFVNFNVDFKIVFKTVQLCINWWIKRTLIASRCTVCVCGKKFYCIYAIFCVVFTRNFCIVFKRNVCIIFTRNFCIVLARKFVLCSGEIFVSCLRGIFILFYAKFCIVFTRNFCVVFTRNFPSHFCVANLGAFAKL